MQWFICLFLFLPLLSWAQNPLPGLLDEAWKARATAHDIQLLYTQIDRSAEDGLRLTTYRWGADSSTYFYPASSVKLPVAILALQHLNELGVEGLSPHSFLFHGPAPAAAPSPAVASDTSSRTGLPSAAHYIRKLLLTSDNDAYNRLFEVLGPSYINSALAQIGIEDTRLIHRVGVGGFTPETHQWLNPIRYTNGYETLYQIGPRRDTFYRALTQVQGQLRGQGYTTDDGTLVEQPFDFRRKNYLSLSALHGILARVVLPEAFPPEQRFELTPADYELLRDAMGQRPRESDYPRYDKPDNYVKFWVYGDQDDATRIPDPIRIYNKVGWAYGYLTDVAYIVDERAGVEFLLSGTIHVNENQIYNDGVYEYDEVGLPFFGEVGRLLLDYERGRGN